MAPLNFGVNHLLKLNSNAGSLGLHLNWLMEGNRNNTSLYPLHVSLSFAEWYSHYTDSLLAAYCTVDTGSRIGQLLQNRYSTLWSLDRLTLIKLLPFFTPTSQQKTNVPSPVPFPPSQGGLGLLLSQYSRSPG